MSYSCIEGSTPGASPFPFPEGVGNIDVDPMFVDQVGGNLHLQRFSPCIDAGNNDADIDVAVAGVQPLGDRDADGAPRFVDDRTVTGVGTEPIVDMGVFESPLVPIFVDASATCEAACDGRTWATAYTALQDALGDAESGDEIWVAAGTYYPTDQSCAVDEDCDGGTPNSCDVVGGSCIWAQPRTRTFELQDGVSLLGGFDGSELTRDARNFGVNDSILSGDIDGDDLLVACTQNSPDCNGFGGVCTARGSCINENNDENSYHVVRASGVNASAVLDGFVIQRGNADGSGDDGRGGGALVSNANPMIRHCRFLGNSASFSGGAAYHLVTGSVVYSSTYVNCLFSGNRTASNGGALYSNVASAIRLLNCTIAGNQATSGFGGGVRAGFGEGVITLTNCVLWGNQDSGDSVQDAQLSFDTGFPSGEPPILTYGVIQRGAGDTLWPGINNIDFPPPKFMDALGPDGIAGTLDDDLRITALSSARARGLNSVILPLTDVDLAGNPRLSESRVDSGAYEFETMPTGSPFLDEDPNFVAKNRYISFQPGDFEAAIAVTLTDSNLFPDLIGETWWVDDPHPSNPDIFSLGCDMVFIDWSQHPQESVISVADEWIFPDSTYTVQAVFDGGVAGTFPITVVTVNPWGDVAGPFVNGVWTPPNGFVNFDDINATTKGFQGDPNAPHVSRIDLEPAIPNAVTNLADVQQVVLAFQGGQYPFLQPLPCGVQGLMGGGGMAGAMLGGEMMEEAIVEPAVLSLIASSSSVAPGEVVVVDVFVEQALDVSAYQVMLVCSGGDAGLMEFESPIIDLEREDFVFADCEVIDAVDVANGRLGAVRFGGGSDVFGNKYLGSFHLRASEDAAGDFSINIQGSGETFIMTTDSTPTPLTPGVGVTITVAME